jgi:hypothetical protein
MGYVVSLRHIYEITQLYPSRVNRDFCDFKNEKSRNLRWYSLSCVLNPGKISNALYEIFFTSKPKAGSHA